MKLIHSSTVRPSSIGVIHSSPIFEAVVTSIPWGADRPVDGGFKAHAEEVFRQIDALLREQGLERSAVTTARIYLQNVREDAAEMNRQWKAFFGNHGPCRLCIGADLQAGMLMEVSFVAELN